MLADVPGGHVCDVLQTGDRSCIRVICVDKHTRFFRYIVVHYVPLKPVGNMEHGNFRCQAGSPAQNTAG